MFLGIGAIFSIVNFISEEGKRKKEKIWIGILITLIGISFVLSDLDRSDKYVHILFPLFALTTILLIITMLYSSIKRLRSYKNKK